MKNGAIIAQQNFHHQQISNPTISLMSCEKRRTPFFCKEEEKSHHQNIIIKIKKIIFLIIDFFSNYRKSMKWQSLRIKRQTILNNRLQNDP